LKAGGSFIKIDGSGVVFSGPVVNVNTGGSPGSGTPAAPLLPGPLKQADADVPGQLLVPALRQSLQRAATTAQPVCEICQKLGAEK
ncbi:type VI secretion system tip protein VgrG, partial [Pseudomonas kitaguniensis]